MWLYGLPPLQDDQIRLLRVSLKSDTIRCIVTIHSLGDDLPEFFALSYTWGLCHRGNWKLQKPSFPTEPSERITCNKNSVKVTENLHAFLCHWVLKHEESTYLWIDALSIDQHNTSEQSHQVNNMGRIYGTASRVLIWLGPEDDSTQLAFELINGLSSLEPDAIAALSSHDVGPHHPNPLLDIARWKAISRLFARTWFSRGWIIQEAIFARTASVLCGPRTTTWEALVKVSTFLANSYWTNFLKDPSCFGDSANQWHLTPARLEAQRNTWKGSYKDGLLYAVVRARSSSCQDPRDKVYSQLRLGHSDVFPDYSRSVLEVYTVAAEHILKQSGSMLLLTCVEGEEFQDRHLNLPSWVPDWTETRQVGLRLTGYRHFHAAGRRPPTYSISQNRRILRVEAVRVDDIVETCDNKELLHNSLHRTSLWQLLSRLDAVHITTHGTQSRGEIVWRSLMTNRGSLPGNRTQYPAVDDYGPSFRNWILWRYAVALEEPTAFPESSTVDDFIPTQTELVETRKRGANDPTVVSALAREASLFDRIYSYALLQRPFRTKQGRFGIGTQCLRENDSIWIVSGCRVPLILRPDDGIEQYKLVGGSYTHGLMDGEGLSVEDVKFQMVSLE